MKKYRFKFKAGMLIKRHWNVSDVDFPQYALVLETILKDSAYSFSKKCYRLRPLSGDDTLDFEHNAMYIDRSYSEDR